MRTAVNWTQWSSLYNPSLLSKQNNLASLKISQWWTIIPKRTIRKREACFLCQTLPKSKLAANDSITKSRWHLVPTRLRSFYVKAMTSPRSMKLTHLWEHKTMSHKWLDRPRWWTIKRKRKRWWPHCTMITPSRPYFTISGQEQTTLKYRLISLTSRDGEDALLFRHPCLCRCSKKTKITNYWSASAAAKSSATKTASASTSRNAKDS